jgi:hypothetical protein
MSFSSSWSAIHFQSLCYPLRPATNAIVTNFKRREHVVEFQHLCHLPCSFGPNTIGIKLECREHAIGFQRFRELPCSLVPDAIAN